MCALTQSRIRPHVHWLPPLHFPFAANRLQKASERLHDWCFVFFWVENPVVYAPGQSKAKERRAARLRIGHFLGVPALGYRLDIPAGTAVRFEPGQSREVSLIQYAGARLVYGFNKAVMGALPQGPAR